MIYLFLFHIIVQPKQCFIHKTITEFSAIVQNFDYFLQLRTHGDEQVLKYSNLQKFTPTLCIKYNTQFFINK